MTSRLTPRVRRNLILAVVLALGALVLVPFVPVALFVVATLTWSPEREAPRLARMPDGAARDGIVLGAELRGAHPFLAEYDRALVLLRGGAEVARIALPRDPGGYARLDVRTAPDGSLRVEDRFGAIHSEGHPAYRADLTTARIVPAPPDTPRGDHLGAFDRAPDGSYRWFPAAERPARDG